MAESRARTLANLANTNALSVDSSSLDVGISSASPDSDLNVGASIKMDGPSGIITATSFSGDGSALTGIANTAVIAATQLTVTGVVTAASFTGDGANLTNVGVDTATVNTGALKVSGISTLTGVVNAGSDVRISGNLNAGITTLGGLSNTITSGNVIALMDSTNNSQNHRVRINSQGTSSSTSLAISNSNANNQSSIVHGNDGGLTIRSDQTAGAEPTTGTAKITIDGTSGNVSIGATLQIGIGKSINFGSTQKAFIQGHSVGVGTTTTAGRNAGLGTAAGTIVFNSESLQLQVYNGDAWEKITGDPITATGGSASPTSRSGFVVHTFTGSGSFQVTAGRGDVEYVIYGGGAGGAGHAGGGGGGAGGVMSGTIPSLGPGTYTVTVGPGGAGGPTSNNHVGTSGGNSSIAVPTGKGGTILAYGGGGGRDNRNTDGQGGAGGGASGVYPGGIGAYGYNPTTPSPDLNPALQPLHPYPITQGYNGGARIAPGMQGGGGGGTGAGAAPDNSVSTNAPNGGNGTTFTITGSSVTKGGGGGGGAHVPGASGGEGGSGGGADGSPQGPDQKAPSASANTASGGGGGGGTQGSAPSSGGDGGSGIIYLAYPST